MGVESFTRGARSDLLISTITPCRAIVSAEDMAKLVVLVRNNYPAAARTAAQIEAHRRG